MPDRRTNGGAKICPEKKDPSDERSLWLACALHFFSRSNEAFALKRRFAQKQQKEEGN